jgi:hypothetical protein
MTAEYAMTEFRSCRSIRWASIVELRIWFYDVGGAPWGPDQSIALPPDSPPSHCNQTASCDIQFAIIDPGSGQPITARRTLTIPH